MDGTCSVGKRASNALFRFGGKRRKYWTERTLKQPLPAEQLSVCPSKTGTNCNIRHREQAEALIGHASINSASMSIPSLENYCKREVGEVSVQANQACCECRK